MDYKEAEQYVLGFTDYEKTPGIAYTSANYDLRRMGKLLLPLGNPHLGAKTVHIAGTKGKGSTAAMVYSSLIAAGYKVGLFTSPHLLTLRERARINDVLISEHEFASIVTEIKPVVEKINREAAFGALTTFEILTAAVFYYFKRNSVDFQVLEVGLGGRLDATNIATGDVCVITSISLDHTAVLGDTIEKIAAEKAGIIKPGCIVINFPQREDAARVIEQTCCDLGARLIQVGADITWERKSGDLYRQSLIIRGKEEVYLVTIPLIGDYQLENAAGAVAALEALRSLGTLIPEEAIVEGLRKVNWPGRLQILREQPLVVVDGAHNAYSMQKLIEAITTYFIFHRALVIFGTSCDKDIPGMVREIVPFADEIVVTNSSHPRAASIPVIAGEFSLQGCQVKTADSVQQALTQAMAIAGRNDLILVTGSLFVVAEAISNADFGIRTAELEK